MLEYLLILLITVAGMMRLTFWSAVVGAGVLVLLPLIERTRASTSPENSSGTSADHDTSSAINLVSVSAAAATAYLLGRTIAWIWSI